MDFCLQCGPEGMCSGCQEEQSKELATLRERVKELEAALSLVTSPGFLEHYQRLEKVVEDGVQQFKRTFAQLLDDDPVAVELGWPLDHATRAATAVGVDGLFFETHPDPDTSPSDGPNMIPLDKFEGLLGRLLEIRKTVEAFE